MKKKSFFLFLVFALAFCGVFLNLDLNLGGVVSADGGTADIWDGKADESGFVSAGVANTYYIQSAGGLAYFAQQVRGSSGSYVSYSGSTIILETDVDLAGIEWAPITPSSSTGSFQGTFDGNGHSIYNIKISSSSGDVGFFGKISGGKIENLHLKNIDISSGNNVGGIAGSFSGGEIERCSVSGNISSGANIGGLVGSTSGIVNISTSKSTVNISNGTGSCGGIVGIATTGEINLTTVGNTGLVSSASGSVGGLIGQIQTGVKSTTSQAYNTGNLSASSVADIGGLIGTLAGQLTLTECFNGGNINAGLDGGDCGGIIGKQTRSNQMLSFCFSAGQISGTTKHGKVVGTQGASIDLSQAVIGYDTESENSYERNLPMLAKTPEFYINHDFWFDQANPLEEESLYWEIGQTSTWNVKTGFNNGFAFLVELETLSFDNTWSGYVSSLQGSGTATSPYLVNTAEELAFVAKKYNSSNQTPGQYYMLTSDIDLTGKTWQPIGISKSYQGFNGVFDGNGHTVKNISCSLQESFIYVGLFGKVTNAVIKNLTVGEYRKLNYSSGVKPGALVGATNGNTYIINCADASGLGISSVGVKESGTLFAFTGLNTTSNGDITLDGAVQSTGYETFVRGGTASSGAGFFYHIPASRQEYSLSDFMEGDYRLLVNNSGELVQARNAAGSIIDSTYKESLLPKGIQLLGTEQSDFVINGEALLSTAMPYKYITDNTKVACDNKFKMTATPSVKLLGGVAAVWMIGIPGGCGCPNCDPDNCNCREDCGCGEDCDGSCGCPGCQGGDEKHCGCPGCTGENCNCDGDCGCGDGCDGSCDCPGCQDHDDFGDNELVVVYNAFELDVFNAVVDRSVSYNNAYLLDAPNEERFEIDANSQVIVKVQIKIGTTLNSNRALYNALINPMYRYLSQECPLRNGFSVEGLYYNYNQSSHTFSNPLNPGAILLKGGTVYAKWKGEEAERKSVTVNIASDDDAVDAAGAVQELRVNKHGKVVSSEIVRMNGTSGSFNFATVLSVDKEGWVDFDLTLNEGYKLTHQTIDKVFQEDRDTNFGVLTTNGKNYFDDVSDFNDLKFYNIVADYNNNGKGDGSLIVNLTVTAMLYTDRLNISEDVFFGVGPLQTITISEQTDEGTKFYTSSLKVYSGTVWTELFSFLSTATKEQCAQLVGVTSFGVAWDAEGWVFVFSGVTTPGIAIRSSDRNDKLYVQNNSNSYFQFEHSGNTVVLRQVDKSFMPQSVLVTMEIDKEIKYVAESSFRFVAAMKSEDGSTISDYKYDMSEFTSATRNMLSNSIRFSDVRPEGSAVQSLVVSYDSVLRADVDAGKYGTLSIVTSFTNATFSFEFKYLDPTTKKIKEFENERYTPSIVDQFSARTYSVATDGTISFVVQSTKYYRFYADLAGSDKVAFGKAEGSYNIYVSKTSGEGMEDFNNASNSQFFHSTSVEAGQVSSSDFVTGSTAINYINYSYKISLGFYHENRGGIEGLRAGSYVITIICTDVFYGLNVGSKHLATVAGSVPNIITRSNLSDVPADSGITTQVVNPTTFENNRRVLKYDELVRIETSCSKSSENFYGWIFLGSDERDDDVRGLKQTSLVFSPIGSIFDEAFSDRTIIDIYALYITKAFTLLLTNTFIENDTIASSQSTGAFTTGVLTAALNGSNVWTYSGGDPTPLTIALSGKNSIGYAVAGFNILSMSGTLKDTRSGSGTFDMGFIKEDIENGKYAGGDDVNFETYQLQPILQLKLVSINVYSGTGTANREFGDGKDGVVRDTKNTVTTDNVYRFSQSFGKTVNLNVDRPSGESLTFEQLFAKRDGYELPDIYYWGCMNGTASVSIYGSDVTLLAEILTQGLTLSIYRQWDSGTFEIVFNANGGSFNDRTVEKRVKVKFEQPFTAGDQVPKYTDITNSGYQLLGWGVATSTNDFLFTKEGVLNTSSAAYSSHTYFDALRNYVYEGNLNVYAIWQTSALVVRIYFNGATSVQEDRTPVSIDGEYKDYSLEYTHTFADLMSGGKTIGLSGIAPYRGGFNFDGFYVIDARNNFKVTDATKFDTSLATFSPSSEVAVVLYARWTIDATQFLLEVIDNTQTKEYTGNPQTFYLTDYFELGNYNERGFVVSTSDKVFGLELENTLAGLAVSWTLSSARISVEKDNFAVTNVGTYVVVLSVTVKDMGKYFNLGTVWSTEINLKADITLATLDVERNEEDQTYYIYNAARMMKPFVETQIYGKVSTASSLEDFATIIRSLNSGDSEIDAKVTPLQIYNYIMVKYFYLMFTDGEAFRQHKLWTYADYAAFAETPQGDGILTSETILDYVAYFDFFDHENISTSIRTEYAKFFKIVSEKHVEESVRIDEVAIFSVIGTNIFPNEFGVQTLRVYLTANPGVLDNYSLSVEAGTGRRYVDIVENGLVLPEVLTKANNIASEDKKTYFSTLYDQRDVKYVPNDDGQTVEVGGRTYHKLTQTYNDAPLYAYALLRTSNGGKAASDTNFAFTLFESGEPNVERNDFLYFSNVEIGYFAGETLQSITNQFRLALTENDLFTILGTGDVAMLNAGTKTLTYGEVDIEYKDVDEERNSGLLTIYSVTYSKGGSDFTVSGNEIPNGAYSDAEGVVIFEVLTNNANSVSLVVNKNFVKEVKIRANNETIYDGFFGLYDWVERNPYTVDGTMAIYEEDGMFFTYTNEMIEESINEEGLTELDRFAVYTNFVYVNYDFNLSGLDTTSYVTSSLLMLGVSKSTDLFVPWIDGLECVGLTILDDAGHRTVDVSHLFGADDTFVGYGSAIFKPINLLATWKILELEYTQFLTDYVGAVGSFVSLSIDDVVDLDNENPNLYDYTYSWYKRVDEGEDELVSEERTFTLPEQGSVAENGKYYILITGDLKEEYRGSLDDPANYHTSAEIEFSLEFKENRVYEIVVPQPQEREFNGHDHLKSPYDDWFNVTVRYYIYSQEKKDYDTENGQEVNLKYITTGSIYFLVFNQATGEKAEEIVNVGSYKIDLKFQDGKFVFLDGVNQENSFYFTVTPREIDLSSEEVNISLEKKFNSDDPELASLLDIRIDDGSFLETLTLRFRRTAGEDVGEYDLFLIGISSEKGFDDGYKFVYDGKTIYQAGSIVSSSTDSVPVGKFYITNSGTLRLSYTEVENNLLQKDFVSGGFSVAVEADEENSGFVLKFTSSEGEFEVKVSLYDETQNAAITNPEIVGFLEKIANTIDAQFFLSNRIEPAINSGVYSYVFGVDPLFASEKNISNYYANVTMADNCKFEIKAKQVVLEELFGADFEKLQKTFDNSPYAQYDIKTGNQIENLAAFSGIYVYATFDTLHAGEKIGVSLTLSNTEDVADDETGEFNIGNYSLSTVRAVGKILKRDATLTLAVQQPSYAYGQISLGKVKDIFTIESLIDNKTNDVKGSMLVEGYYQLSYSIATVDGTDLSAHPELHYTNNNGEGTFLLKGTYTVRVQIAFDDFNITNADGNVLSDNPSFEVTPKEIEYVVRDGFITRTLRKARDFVSYTEGYTVAETGDLLDLVFVLTDNIETFVVGQYYSISLQSGEDKVKEMEYLSGSIKFKIVGTDGTENNNGFYVQQADEVLYVKLVLTEQEYNGQFFGFVTDGMMEEGQKLLLNEIEVGVSFVTFEGDDADESVVEANSFSFATFQIEIIGALAEDGGKVKNAGNYRLALSASVVGGEFGNIMFFEEYKLVIKKKTINVEELEIEKYYNGKTDVDIVVDRNLLAPGDELTLSGQFSDPNVAEEKDLRFVGMQGDAVANYELSSPTAKGTIKAANAKITIDGDKKRYTYGDIKQISEGYIGLNFVVYDISNGDLVSNKLPISQNLYNALSITIEAKGDVSGGLYSGLGYLHAGTYTLKVSGTARNYVLESLETEIEVVPYQFTLTYKEDGEITVEYGSSQLQGKYYSFTLVEENAPLAEKLDISLEIEVDEAIGVQPNKFYHIIAADCENLDYAITTDDRSDNGALRVIRMLSSLVYVLFADGTNETSFEYDANIYDQIVVESRLVEDTMKHFLVVKNAVTDQRKEFELDFFVRQEGAYVKYTGQVQGFVAEGLSVVSQNSLDPFVNRVGTYFIYAGSSVNSTYSDTNEVRLGKSATEALFAFKLTVEPKVLHFKNENSLLKEYFTNAAAKFVYDVDLLDAELEEDDLKLEVTFVTSLGQPAVFVSEDAYDITAKLTGANAGNYVIEATTTDGTAVKGQILKTAVVINLSDAKLTFVYGDEISDFNFTYQFASELVQFDLQTYLALGRRFVVTTNIDGEKSAGSQNFVVGSHDIEILLESDDFELSGFVGGTQNELGKLVGGLTILPRPITLEEKDIPLANVFTKAYDGTTELNIFADEGREELLFALANIIERDDVTITDAEFATVSGDAVKINFTLDGVDASNYTAPNMTGRIVAINIRLTFENTEEGAEFALGGRQLLSEIAFPLKNLQSLTDNAVSNVQKDKGSFPTKFEVGTIPEGREFLYWTMNFDLSENANAEELKELLNNLKYQISGFTVIADAENPNILKVVVGNDAKTVAFLSQIVGNDQYRDLGYSFKDVSADEGSDAVEVTFVSNWDTLKENIKVFVADETGAVAERGTVNVEISSPTTSENAVTSFVGKVDYGQSFSVTVNPADHFVLDAFYDGDKYLLAGEGNVAISGRTLTISNVKEDHTIYVRLRIQKVIVELELPNDASINDENFHKKEGVEENIYEWETEFDNLEEYTLQDLHDHIVREGYDIKGFEVNGRQYFEENFGNSLADFVENMQDGTQLSIKPIYDAVVYEITYETDDGVWVDESRVTKSYTADYGATLPTGDDITKKGYDFAGWFTDRNFADDTLKTAIAPGETGDITLFAKWNIKKSKIEITYQNASMSEEKFVSDGEPLGNLFEHTDGQAVANEVAYGTSVSFALSAETTYTLDIAIWDTLKEDYGFEVEFLNTQKTLARVSFLMPDEDLTFAIVAKLITYTVTFNTENLEIVATDTTNDQILETTSGSVEIVMYHTLQFVVTPIGHFEISDVVDIVGQTFGLVVNTQVTDNVLTLTIDGIAADLALTFHSTQLPVDIVLKFSDDEAVDSVRIDDKTYTGVGLLALPNISALAGSDFSTSIFVLYKFGYDFDNVAPTNCTAVKLDKDDEGWYEIQISAILDRGEVLISSKLVKFDVALEVVTFNSVGEEQSSTNTAYFGNETTVSEKEVEFLSTLTLTAVKGDEDYEFAGWSLNRQSGNYLSENANFACRFTAEILQNASVDERGNYVIYAVFTTKVVEINLDARLYYKLFEEYEDDQPDKVKEVYEVIPAPVFTNERGDVVTSVSYNFGLDLQFNVQIPDGYLYRGYGYYETDDNFVLLGGEVTSGKQISVEIKNGEFGVGVKTIFVVLVASATRLSVSTTIDVGGFKEEDVNVGRVKLVDAEGNDVNEYGYVEGTKVHYENNVYGTKRFAVIAYTANKVFLKVDTERDGYIVDRVEAKLQAGGDFDAPVASLVLSTSTYKIFCIDNLVGGRYVDVLVVFAPVLNIIDLDFLNNNEVAEGGVFEVLPASGNEHKVWTSGSDYSALTVMAYTDSSFEIVAYVRAGYVVDIRRVRGELCEYAIVEKNSVQYSDLSITETGYVGKVTFKINGGIEEFLGRNHIFISLNSSKYTVVFKDGDKVLAKIENVLFNTNVNLSQINSANIQRIDPSIRYSQGKLNLVQRKTGYSFMGYFTGQNGAGKQYLDYNGDVVGKWLESGYVYNKITNLFDMSENLQIVDGNFEISIYQYQSFQKTRINVNIVPTESITYTAQDIISGVDYTNSWYYDASPHYMEVSFNTDIYFTAPKINGYQFYKFIIKQRNGNGDWVPDVESFAESLPWSTNIKDNYVECEVQIVYFAQIDIRIVGGEVEEIAIEQASVQDGQGKALLQKGFVNTGEEFTLTAKLKEGYRFLNWRVLSEGGAISSDNPLKMKAVVRRASVVLNLEGERVVLDFQRYDTHYGQIREMYSEVINGETYSYVLGTGAGLTFVKERERVETAVGCTVSFALTVDEGYAVVWNKENVSYLGYDKNLARHIFSLKITVEHSKETNAVGEKVVEIVPTFENTAFAIYITNSFVEDDIISGALDNNDVSLAGGVMFQGEETRFFSISNKNAISIDTFCNPRYAIGNVTISNMGQTLPDMSEFFQEDGKIVLSKELIEKYNIQGTLYVHLEFTRLLWDEFETTTVEFEGKGTSRNPYKISSKEELTQMMKLCNSGATNDSSIKYNECFWEVVEDIDLLDRFWTPIGTREQMFNGYFNFNGHTVSSIGTVVEFNPIRYNGLFGVVGSGATIILSRTSYWYIWLIIIILLLLILIIVLFIIFNKKKRKEREELSKK